MKIRVELSRESVDRAIAQIEAYKAGLNKKATELCERLAQMGAVYAEWNFSGVLYAGDIDYHISVKKGDGNTYLVLADGETVLLLEFGAGVRHGGGHPQAGEFGMGPGTYPGQTHAFDPNGWWFKSDSGMMHTYGHAPGMSMYNAAKDLRKEIEEVAREVFQS